MSYYLVIPFPGCGKAESFSTLMEACRCYRQHEKFMFLVYLKDGKLPYTIVQQRL